MQRESGNVVGAGDDRRRIDRDVVGRKDHRIFARRPFVHQDLVTDPLDVAAHRVLRAVDADRDRDVGGVRVAQFGDVPQQKRKSQQPEKDGIAEPACGHFGVQQYFMHDEAILVEQSK